MNNHFTVIFDSSVLYPAPIRDLLIQTASTGLFRGKLTAQIHHEWTSNLLKNRPDLKIEQLERTCRFIEISIPDCLVTGFEPLIESLSLPDPNDRHVLAAAICCQAQLIVTSNLKDFPLEKLASFGIEAQHPDTFLRSQADLALPQFLGCVKTIRERLKNPPISAQNYLIELASQGLVQTASFLGDFVAII